MLKDQNLSKISLFVRCFVIRDAQSGMDGWMDELLEILRPFQQYFSHIRTMSGWLWKAVCKGTLLTIRKISPQVGLEPGTARSVDQCLTYWANRALTLKKNVLLQLLQHANEIKMTSYWCGCDVDQATSHTWNNVRRKRENWNMIYMYWQKTQTVIAVASDFRLIQIRILCIGYQSPKPLRQKNMHSGCKTHLYIVLKESKIF